MKKHYTWLLPFEVSDASVDSQWHQGSKNIHADYINFTADRKSSLLNQNQKVAYCDFQRSPGSPLNFSGSGRSAFFEESYVKGIGRTPLAYAWKGENFLHSHGILHPSAAIREMVLTLFFAKLDPGLINGLTGLNLSETSSYSSGVLDKVHGISQSLPCAADSAFTAQTHKAGNFARPSNVLWSIRNLGSFVTDNIERATFDQIFSDLNHSLDRQLTSVAHEVQIFREKEEFRILWEKLSRGLNLGVLNTAKINAHGVKLVSLDNNYALDGRFLDLEIPLFMGRGLSLLETQEGSFRPYQLIEAISICHQSRQFLKELGQWLDAVVKNSSGIGFSSRAVAAKEAFLEVFCSDNWLLNDQKLTTGLIETYSEVYSSPTSDLFKRLLLLGLRYPWNEFKFSDFGIRSEVLDFDLAPLELGRRVRGVRLMGITEDENDSRSQARMIQFNQAIVISENTNDKTQIFTALKSLEE